MDGLLIVDKPAGPTSHDVVARIRRVLREPRVGHTGTLDPLATGVLPLVVGRATRLARFLSASDKSYEAVIALTHATDTGDRLGQTIGDWQNRAAAPPHDAIERALDTFRGTFMQQPPAFSAKKIGGQRSYKIARRDARKEDSPAVSLSNHERAAPTPVTVHRLELRGIDGATITIALDCSAGFYVRALAHDLGERLGTGGHLVELRRTRSGDYTLDDAVPLAALEEGPAMAASRLVPPARMLTRLPAIELTADDVRRARHGQDVAERGVIPTGGHVRLLDAAGELIGIAEPARASGFLHPCVVLG